MTSTLDARSREALDMLYMLERSVKIDAHRSAFVLSNPKRTMLMNLIAEQREEIERLTAAMVLVPRMTLGPQS